VGGAVVEVADVAEVKASSAEMARRRAMVGESVVMSVDRLMNE
jgi:hypothetical protein